MERRLALSFRLRKWKRRLVRSGPPSPLSLSHPCVDERRFHVLDGLPDGFGEDGISLVVDHKGVVREREEHVVRSRFGLQTRPGCFTLQRLADEYGVTRERIRQLERRALKKLRQMAMESESWSALHWYAD